MLPRVSQPEARQSLIQILQLAYSGELAAAWAYVGHRRSLRDAKLRRELGRILRDELEHRACVGRMLKALGAAPDEQRERKMRRVGQVIAVLCQVGGFFWPMYGAGLLESQNIREYEHAARLASLCAHDELVPELLHMAEAEWDHELYFHEQVRAHLLGSLLPRWQRPPARSLIRQSFEAFVKGEHTLLEPLRVLPLTR